MLNKLPEELTQHILDFAYTCKKEQNFYVNKEVQIYVCKKKQKCKKFMMFKKEVCSGCNEKELNQLKWIFHYNIF